MKLYFMGICGTAMGNVALLARAAGHEVLGADSGVYPPMSTVLAEAGISLLEGYDPGRLEKLRPDLVVIGNAMSRGNAEVEWLLESRALAFTSLPALLHDLVLRKRRNVVVAGTHGKTTTTALTAFLLRENGCDPGFLIGGVPQDPPVGSHLGSEADPFVIEGDEYDSAFFDKRSKFIHYAPHIAVLNNLEFDHADIFRDLADVQRTFSHLTRIVPRNGWVLLNGDDEALRALGPLPWTQVLRVGMGEGCEVRIEDFQESSAGAAFSLSWGDEPWARVQWSLPGLFNARNAAMAAAAAALALGPERVGARVPESRSGVPPLSMAKAAGCRFYIAGSEGAPLPPIDLSPLARFRGVKRRQEMLVSTPALTVIEDFGHHPTALAETLRSFRTRFPGQRLTAVFEPRSNTARTQVLQDDFLRALALADEVYLGAVNRSDKLRPDERFDVDLVSRTLERQGVRAVTAATNEELLARLLADTTAQKEGARVVIFFSNGSFDGIIGRFSKACSAGGSAIADGR